TVNVTDSTFSGNSSDSGGAITNVGAAALTVTNSTFSGNSGGYGGAILNSSDLSLANSTFSRNSVPGPPSRPRGGGLYNSGTVTVVNSILAASEGRGNCATEGGGTITDSGHNIDDGTTCGFTGANCAYCVGGDFPGAGCSADSDCTGTPPTPNGTCTAT